MGGNLYHLGRLPAAGYWPLEARVRQVLEQVFGEQWRIPHSHRDKADFGDLDILVSADHLTAETLAQFQELLVVSEYRYVRPVHSHAVPLRSEEQAGGQTHFQVDLFAIDSERLTVQHDFMSWGDCGNILARLAKRWNLKWGQDGLWYVLRWPDDEHARAERLLTREITRLLSLLELDVNQYQAGFASERQMFEWILASPQFSPRPFQQLQGQLAKKARTRPGMQRFAAFVVERFGEEQPQKQPPLDPAPFFPELNLPGWIEEQQAEYQRQAVLKAKLDGRLVMKLRPELSGRALGAFLKALRQSQIGGAPFEAWLLGASETQIAAYIRDFAPDGTPRELRLSQSELERF